jgi:hypothetical protein
VHGPRPERASVLAALLRHMRTLSKARLAVRSRWEHRFYKLIYASIGIPIANTARPQDAALGAVTKREQRMRFGPHAYNGTRQKTQPPVRKERVTLASLLLIAR